MGGRAAPGFFRRVAAVASKPELPRAPRRAAQPSAVPEARLENQPRAHDRPGAAAARPRLAAGRDALRRQAHHRRGRAARGASHAGRDRCAIGLRAAARPPRRAAARWSSGSRSLSDVLGRFVSLLDSLLSEHFSNETSLRLMEHAATLDLEDFEDSELQDRLERARRQAAGRMAPHRPALRPGAGRRHDRRASPRASSSTRRGSSCCWPSRSCRRSSARRTSTRRATRSTTRARPSGASSTTCARPAPASRRRRK